MPARKPSVLATMAVIAVIALSGAGCAVAPGTASVPGGGQAKGVNADAVNGTVPPLSGDALRQQEGKVNACIQNGGTYDKVKETCVAASAETQPVGKDVVSACNSSGGGYDIKAGRCGCPTGLTLTDDQVKCVDAKTGEPKPVFVSKPLGGDLVASCEQTGGVYNVKVAKCACPNGTRLKTATGECL